MCFVAHCDVGILILRQRNLSKQSLLRFICLNIKNFTVYVMKSSKNCNSKMDHEELVFTPCHFSPLAEIPGSIEFLENSLTFEGVEWRKIIEL